MNRLFFTCIAALLIAALQTAGAQQGAAQIEKQLARAHHKATVDGDLPGAIEEYKRIVATAGSNRAVAAKALVRMAECYQKLGDAESRKIYERLVRDYADQKESAAIARARLGNAVKTAKTDAMVSRRVWTLPPAGDIYGAISSTGQVMSYVDWQTGDLAVHDFTTNRDRALTNKGTWAQSLEYAETSTISPDDRQVAFSWYNGDTYDLRVVSMEATQLPQAKTLFVNKDVSWLAPMDWSPDGRWIVVQLTRADRTDQLALVATGDGSLQVLKSSEWRGALEVFFSPDGKYLGFDLPADDTNTQRDVFVLAVDGSRQTGIALGQSHDTMIGWSPDGTRLLFASDRSGSTGLWSQLMVDGRPQSEPELLKTEISRNSVGVTRAGRLYTGVSLGNRDINVVSVDFATGKPLNAPVRPIRSFVGLNQQPAWSHDGKSMAFISARDRAGINRVLGIYSTDTGLVRDLRPELAYFDGPDWAPDGRSVVVRGRNLKGVRGAYAIDVQSGAARRVVSPRDDGGAFGPQWSHDGKKIYYRRSGSAPNTFAFFEVDVDSQTEREVVGRAELLGHPSVSPDGRWIATTVGDKAVWLFPVGEGEPREVFRAQAYEPQGIARYVAWTPDGRSVLISVNRNLGDAAATRRDGVEGGRDLLLVPVTGGQSRKIHVDAQCCEVKIHPDGKQIAFLSGEGKSEVWVLENFLPPDGGKN